MDPSRLIAHRGYPARYPENTLPGFQAALDCGALFVEADVQITSDDVPVLFHDRTMERVCGVAGGVRERSRDEILALRASEAGRFRDLYRDVPVALLADLVALLGRFPRATFFVDVKSIAVEQLGITRVLDHILAELGSVEERAILLSQLPEVTQELQRRGQPCGLVLSDWEQPSDPAVAGQTLAYDFCNVTRLPEAGGLRRPGRRLAVYDVVDPVLAADLLDRGADLVETFAIGQMIGAGAS